MALGEGAGNGGRPPPPRAHAVPGRTQPHPHAAASVKRCPSTVAPRKHLAHCLPARHGVCKGKSRGAGNGEPLCRAPPCGPLCLQTPRRVPSVDGPQRPAYTAGGGVGVSPSRVVQRAPVPCAAPLGSLQTERGAAMDAAQSGGRRLRSRADPWGACAPDAWSAPETTTRGHGAAPAEAPAHERRAGFDVHLSGGAVSKRNISRRARGEGRARPDLDATAGLVTAGRPPAGNLRPPLSSGGADVTCDGDAVTQKMWPLHMRSRREGRASPDTAGERVNIYRSFLEGIWQRVQSLKVMLTAQL